MIFSNIIDVKIPMLCARANDGRLVLKHLLVIKLEKYKRF